MNTIITILAIRETGKSYEIFPPTFESILTLRRGTITFELFN